MLQLLLGFSHGNMEDGPGAPGRDIGDLRMDRSDWVFVGDGSGAPKL